MKCPICDEPIKIARALIDNQGVTVGLYCSKDCAENDAWGPRFRPLLTRRTTKADLKMYERSN